MRSALVIGLGSGLVSAGVAISAARGSPALQGLMMMLAPLPLLIAGLGWGWIAALAGMVIGAGMLALGVRTGTGAAFTIMVGAPAVLASYLVYLARDRRDGQGADWFPVGSVVGAVGLYAASVPLFLLQLIGNTFEVLRQPLADFYRRVFQEAGREFGMATPTPEQIDQAAAIGVAILPAAIASTWAMVFCLALYLSARVTRAAGLLTRDWPDFTALTLPRELSLLFLAAIAATFVPGVPRLVGTALIGGLLVPLMTVGLATLHTLARRGKRWLLWITYACLLVLWPIGTYFIGLILAVVGFLEPILNLRGRLPAPPSTPTT
jgi:hypothetical protein